MMKKKKKYPAIVMREKDIEAEIQLIHKGSQRVK